MSSCVDGGVELTWILLNTVRVKDDLVDLCTGASQLKGLFLPWMQFRWMRASRSMTTVRHSKDTGIVADREGSDC